MKLIRLTALAMLILVSAIYLRIGAMQSTQSQSLKREVIRMGTVDANAKKQLYELTRLRRILPKSEPWEKWLRESGELPPDFDELPSMPFLPNPLVIQRGDKLVTITTSDEWAEQRERIRKLFHRWVIGTVPPPPNNLHADVISERNENGVTVREVVLSFGPERRAHLWLELLVPPADNPLPVFMTQHNHRAWALIAVRRGYVACVYAGADSRDDTASFIDAYPDYDWSKLARRAWAVGRCIDYLQTLPFVDASKIALTGHSRNGKQSLIAAALDERIAVVISSSSGAGGACTYRYFGEHHFGEGIELLTRVFPDWYHPRLRFFVGREHKLPVDNHMLIALIAPRPCLIATALNDGVESTWAIQQTYLEAKRVYQLLHAEDKLRILWRYGSHETKARDIEQYIDWCDLHFGRGDYEFPEVLLHPHDFKEWQRISGITIDPNAFPAKGLDDPLVRDDGTRIRNADEWREHRRELQIKVASFLGDEPPCALNPGGNYGVEKLHTAVMLGRAHAPKGLEKRSLVFGEYISADIWMPEGAGESGKRHPAVLWLHPFSFSHGYVAAYRRGEQPFINFARNGFVVFCYDQIGFGTRIEEVTHFYERHPKWSLLGKMVHDARAALDALEHLEFIDPKRIFVVGYALGGMVALHLCALDERPAGIASICGFTPMRLDTPEKPTGGIRRWSHLYMLLPQLGFFIGHEERIPYDYHELLSLIAPRHCLIIAPQLDREATLQDVRQCIEVAHRVYEFLGVPERLQLITPDDYNRFGPEMQALAINWLKRVASGA